MTTLRWTLIIGIVAIGFVVACKLDPAKTPPCEPGSTYPDPCAASPRDAGRDG